MKLVDPLQDLRRKQRAELRRLRKEAKQEARAERRASWAARWPRWTAWWEKRARELKIAGMVVAGAAAVVSGGIGLVNGVKKAWAVWSARDVGDVLPPPTGAQTTALDFVRKHPPDGGR